MRDLPQYDRRAVNVPLTLTELHELLGLRGEARITNVHYASDRQVLTFTVESPTLSLVPACHELMLVPLTIMQEHRS